MRCVFLFFCEVIVLPRRTKNKIQTNIMEGSARADGAANSAAKDFAFGFAFAFDGIDPQLTVSQQKRKREAGQDVFEEQPDPVGKRAAASNFIANFPPKFDWFRYNPPPTKTQTFRT